MCSVAKLLTVDIQSLRVRLEESFPSAAVPSRSLCSLSTGVAPLDRVLEGGLTQGVVTAWVGSCGSGLLSLLRASVVTSLAKGLRVAVVDGTRSFCASDWVGISQSTNLWFIRPPAVKQSLGAAEVLARSGAFELVAVDLGSQRAAFSSTQNAHLRRAVKEGGASLVLLGKQVGPLSAVVLEIAPLDLDLTSQKRTLELTLVRGGFPRKEQVVLDVSLYLGSRRLPSHSPFPDRRPRSKGSGRGSGSLCADGRGGDTRSY